MRARVQQLVTLELGPRSDREIRNSLQMQAEAERWTRLDRVLGREAAAKSGVVDLRLDHSRQPDEFHAVKIARMRKLEGLGLAQSGGPSHWVLSENTEHTLRQLGERNDIIRRIDRGLAEKGWERGLGGYVLDSESQDSPVVGRLVARGIDDEIGGSAYVVIDGVDGRAHHLRLPDLDAAGDSAPGSIVELRRYQDAAGRNRIGIAIRSDLPIETQVTARGATWLDRRLVAANPLPLSGGGFGADVSRALDARIDHLVEEGVARRQAQRVIFARDLLATLRRRELAETASRVSTETGLPHQPIAEGDRVDGIYRRRIALASGRFAMIDDGLGFILVPWSPSLERHLGRQVSGIAQASGAIDWSFGRKRGLGL